MDPNSAPPPAAGSPELNPPDAVREIAERLESEGYETWAVGGAVRDALLGRPRGDWDLATRARPDTVRGTFRRTVPVGIEHGTVGVFGRDGVLYEVTTFRRDVETFGRHAVVEFADRLEEDLARRDFTFNAVAWHPITGELRDPFGGMQDLRAGRLRTVGEPADRFAEDYLRVLRALRFAGEFRLSVDPPTWRALAAAAPRLTGLSAERVREELWKVLAMSRTASAALSLYAASGALAVLYPELDALVGLEEDRGLDVWSETLFALDAVPPSRTVLRAAILLHALGMPAARSRDLRGGWRYTGHERIGARKAAEVMRRLRASNAEAARVERLVRLQSDLFPPDSPDAVVRRWLVHVGPDLVHDLFRLAFALRRARVCAERASGVVRQPAPTSATAPAGAPDLRQRAAHARRILRSRPPLAIGDLAVSGHDLRELGLEPGPRYGEILRALLDRVLDRPELNTKEALVEVVRRELAR